MEALRQELQRRQLARAKRAAQHFDIGVSTLWLWAKTRPGFPPPIKAGKGVTLFDIAAIENYLLDGKAA